MNRAEVVAVLLFAASTAAWAQEGEPAGPEEKVLQFNFRDASIDTVLEYLSQQTGMAVVKKVPISGKITAVSAEKIPVSQALAFVNSVLIDQQVAAIQVGNIIKVLSLEQALKENHDIVVVRSPDEVEMSDRILTAIIPLEFIDPAEVKKELGTLIVDNGILLVNTKANALVLSDTATNVKR
ncbi:MAG: hypothetical protein HY720_29420, partial [Planctomycetes bacterium]|nr:hypothetical protein [Planctomycetota bacterium]